VFTTISHTEDAVLAQTASSRRTDEPTNSLVSLTTHAQPGGLLHSTAQSAEDRLASVSISSAAWTTQHSPGPGSCRYLPTKQSWSRRSVQDILLHIHTHKETNNHILYI